MHLGIDLGTSNSAAASYTDGKLRLLKTVDKNADVLPSVIYIDGRGNRFYGHRAYEHLFKNPDLAVDGFKRQLGTAWQKEFAKSGVTLTAEECSAEILRQLRAQAEVAHGNEPISGVVITTPAAFNQMQIEATKRAAGMADMEQVALLQEPVAAAMAAVAESRNKDGLFLVYDIGGGTFDLALAQSVGGKITIIAHDGINTLGGRDFDRIIINSIARPWLLENFSLPADFQKQPKYEKMIRIMKMAAEQAKIELSTKDSAKVYLSDDDLRVTDEDGNDIYIEIPIERARFNELIHDKLVETIELSHKILKSEGYSSEDIDKLVLIGGPSKMPGLRDLVPQQLGIACDISVDPMTAVALGAAIFCEGVDWSNTELARKKTRERAEIAGDVNVRFDYENRTAQDRARVRVRAADQATYGRGLSVQVDSTEGWTSGRKPLTADLTLELPLDNMGENHFRGMLFAASGESIESAVTEIVITRTMAGAGALKLTHNLAAMIVKGDADGEHHNALHVFAEKGIDLPAKGEMPAYRSIRDLVDPDDGMIVQFYQQPVKGNDTPGEPNLFIGAVDIKRAKIKADIMKGDPLSILWSVDESGIIAVQIRIDKTGEVMGGKFYSSELGHLSYEGRAGEQLVADMLKGARGELEAGEKLSDTAKLDLRKHHNALGELASEAQNTVDSEERRAICEKIRDIRQKIHEYRNDPKELKNSLMQELEDVIGNFDGDFRESADAETAERFDELARQARNDISASAPNTDDAKRCIDEMRTIVQHELLSNPKFVMGLFHYAAEQRHNAIDTIVHDDLVRQGEEAMQARDIDALRPIIGQLFANQIGGDSGGGGISSKVLADIALR